MSENPILAALARLETGQAELGAKLARLEAEQEMLRAEMRGLFEQVEKMLHRINTDVKNYGR